MSIAEAYEWALGSLSDLYSDREAQQVVDLLFEDKFGISNSKKIGEWDDKQELEEAIERLKSGEPIQYVTEIAHFYGRKFKVNKNVLIPRPETEELVYNLLKQVKSSNKQIDVLDIGTGSGCIPITLKKEKPSLRVFTMDYNQDVVNLAKINARQIGAQVVFYKFDFLDAEYWSHMGCFDILISNPPYITDDERALMGDSVLNFEPARALFALGDDPLIFYKRIADFAEDHLNKDGTVFLELNQYHALGIDEIYKAKGYETEIIKDLQGNDRMLKAVKS